MGVHSERTIEIHPNEPYKTNDICDPNEPYTAQLARARIDAAKKNLDIVDIRSAEYDLNCAENYVASLLTAKKFRFLGKDLSKQIADLKRLADLYSKESLVFIRFLFTE